MKDVSEVVACVVDGGTFISLADKLSETYAKTYYYSNHEREFKNIADCCKGDGLDREGHRLERLDDFMDPDVLKTIDLFIFPDIGWAGHQKYLRSIGKAVWGSMGGDDLELYRTRFIKVLKKVGLPMVPTEVIHGVDNLAEHLKHVEDKWIKLNRYRDNMETWHHQDYLHSRDALKHYDLEFGDLPVTFVVQDAIDSDVEIGYDGWSVDGWFPDKSYQGYEKKNELYLGSCLHYDDLPEGVRYVNEKFSKVMEGMKYRNFFATEIRLKDDVPYFIDPTMRMPGQTGEQLLETCKNLARVIWEGAQGELIQPDFEFKFAAEATVHFTGTPSDSGWRVLNVPPESERWFKPVQYCMLNGTYRFPPHRNDEVGVILGCGNTIMEAVEALKINFEAMKKEPVSIQFNQFTDLIKEVQEAEEQGMEFTPQDVPEPAEILEVEAKKS